MSNSTRPSGYDDRLVGPLEASRRGAHRARVNPLVGVLPLLAVVVVVAAVIGVAYTLFLKPNSSDTGGQPLPTVSSAPPTTTSSAGVRPSTSSGASGTTSPTTSASASKATAAVDKTVPFTVYNGSTAPITGLGRRAAAALQNGGWSGAQVVTGAPPSAAGRSQTTRVYFAKDSQRATAEALQKALKVGTVKQSATIAAQGIVVIVGDDYNA
jgi:LytR cell envelope-related transcriptional attenuator